MKITHLELDTVQVNERETWVFVQVHTDAGLTGLGELNPSAPRSLCIEALQRLSRRLLGRDPRRITSLYADLRGEVSDLVGVRALSALEQCLWDLLGQSLQAPIHVLMGGTCHDAIRLYANITRATPSRTPEAFARNAVGAAADGFTAVKLAPFAGGRPIDRINHLEESLECVRAVRRAVGPDVDIMLDCYGLFTATAALDIVDALAGVELVLVGGASRTRRLGELSGGQGALSGAVSRRRGLRVSRWILAGAGPPGIRHRDAGRGRGRRYFRAGQGRLGGGEPGDSDIPAWALRPGDTGGQRPGDGDPPRISHAGVPMGT